MKRVIFAACGIYLAVIALAAASTGAGLIAPVPGYRLSLFWMAPDTLETRLSALIAAGRAPEAFVYASSHTLSWALIGLLALLGLVWPFLNPLKPLANIRSTAVVMGGLAGFLFLSVAARPLLDEASRIPSPSTVLSAMPAYWFLGMALGAAITAAHLALILHDIALWARTHLRPADLSEPA